MEMRWDWSSSVVYGNPSTEVFDGAHGDRIGIFDSPWMPPIGTAVMLAGDQRATVEFVEVNLSNDRTGAVVYVTLRLESSEDYWRFVHAMAPLPISDEDRL